MTQCHHDTRFVHIIDNNSELRYSNRRPSTSHDAGGMRVRLLVITSDSLFPSFFPTASISLAMLFLLLMYFLTRRNLGGDANPIPLLERRADVPCNDLNQDRTTWSIVWGCLSTIFLCTWVTLHPNIAIAPDTRGKSGFAKFWHRARAFMKNKLLLFLWALIAPEYILAWANRQSIKAEQIQREFNDHWRDADGSPDPFRKWTRAHGFFLIMGGFHLYSLPDGAPSVAYPPELLISSNFVIPPSGPSREGGTAEHPLDFHDLTAHELAYFAPNEKEIKDKGKTDSIARILVLLQISWFVAQCIARGVQHLPLTTLEVVTLAYAGTNAVIYRYWWHKPKDVECPVRLYKAPNAAGVVREKKKEWESGMQGTLQLIATYVAGAQDASFQLHEESQVPMFWSGKIPDSMQMPSLAVASYLAMAFGAIHFIAWNTEFSSYIELLLWRISCVVMIVTPLFVGLLWTNMLESKEIVDTWISSVLTSLSLVFYMVPILLYFFARFATLVVAFTTLWALPSDAFKTVDWTNFIPHI